MEVLEGKEKNPTSSWKPYYIFQGLVRETVYVRVGKGNEKLVHA